MRLPPDVALPLTAGIQESRPLAYARYRAYDRASTVAELRRQIATSYLYRGGRMWYRGVAFFVGAISIACSRPSATVAAVHPCAAVTADTVALRRLMADTTHVVALQRLAADTATTTALRRVLADTAATATLRRTFSDTAWQSQMQPLIEKLDAELGRLRQCVSQRPGIGTPAI